ncbi:TPA: hypothetical protein ACSPLY_002746 [Pseudomonas aeruginosa]
MKPVLLMIVNDPAFFMSHRLPVAVGAQQAGFQVHIATRPGDAVKKIVSQGFLHHELPLSRSGKNPFSELYLGAFCGDCGLMFYTWLPSSR